MLNRMSRRALVGGLAGLALHRAPVVAAEPAGAVESARGECYARTAASRRTLAPASDIFVGDAIGTGAQSALSMHLGASTKVRLGANAMLRIDRFVVNAGGLLVLDNGPMLYDHDPDAGQSDLTVRSPFGLVAVRGTRFFAGPSNGVFGVFVERGSVMVVGVNTAVVVSGGSGSDIERPGAEPTNPHPWGAGRIAAAMASVTP